MKAKLVEREAEKKFEPFSIEITFESRDEAERFYAIFNCVPISGWIDWQCRQIRRAINEKAPVGEHSPENSFSELLDRMGV